jgi:hypothetical protein
MKIRALNKFDSHAKGRTRLFTHDDDDYHTLCCSFVCPSSLLRSFLVAFIIQKSIDCESAMDKPILNVVTTVSLLYILIASSSSSFQIKPEQKQALTWKIKNFDLFLGSQFRQLTQEFRPFENSVFKLNLAKRHTVDNAKDTLELSLVREEDLAGKLSGDITVFGGGKAWWKEGFGELLGC